jgi:hypothetical protein
MVELRVTRCDGTVKLNNIRTEELSVALGSVAMRFSISDADPKSVQSLTITRLPKESGNG